MKDPYIRQASVVRVIDGDTLQIDLDLGFYITRRETTRLAGINAPEMVGPSKSAGTLSKLWLQNLLPPGTAVTVQTVKPNDKYGRYLATIWRTGELVSVNDQMIAAGHATPY